MTDLDLEKQHETVIQQRAGRNNELLEKGMEHHHHLSSIY